MDAINNLLEPMRPMSIEETYIACMLIKNMVDLCDLGIDILRTIKNPKGLPDKGSLQTFRILLGSLYKESFFTKDIKNPNWNQIESHNKQLTETYCRVYITIETNLKKYPAIVPNLKSHNRQYFIDNFDLFFKDMPFDSQLQSFKNLLSSDKIPEEDQDEVWDFFEVMLDLFVNKESKLKSLKRS